KHPEDGGLSRLGSLKIQRLYSGAGHMVLRQPRSTSPFFALTLLAASPMLGIATAHPKPLPSESYPGPWLEIGQEIRDILILRGISAGTEAVGRRSSYRNDE